MQDYNAGLALPQPETETLTSLEPCWGREAESQAPVPEEEPGAAARKGTAVPHSLLQGSLGLISRVRW